jgi:hypothetical protein
MTTDQLKKMFGDEYPAAVIVDGTRLPLRREGRFSRSYGSQEQKLGTEVSRFMDGSASITASELLRGWPTWTDGQRSEFCGSCVWLHKQPDFPEMLRFIMQHGDPTHWSEIAVSVASCLPQNEAFETLSRALPKLGIEPACNLLQAIAHTKHPAAEKTLREHLAALWPNRRFGMTPTSSTGRDTTRPRVFNISSSLALHLKISWSKCANFPGISVRTTATRAGGFWPSIIHGLPESNHGSESGVAA